MSLRKRAAFTLIELLVVISIIALLMAILMPALQRVRRQAQAVACQSNLKQMGLAFSMYTGDNNGYFHQEEGSESSRSWVPAMRAYYSHQPKIRACPATTKFYSDGVTGPLVGWGVYGRGNLASVPSWAMAGDYGSFGLNGWVANDTGGIHTNKNWRSIQIQGGFQVPVFVDCQWVDGLPEPYDSPPDFDGQCQWQWYGNAMRSFCVNRHNGSVNGVFIDLSTRPIGLKELWEVHWHRQWAKDRAAKATPVWPDWMKSFKDYAPL
jgi:prepilin-type N-terminal cleavage/methylation domain-containing protein